MQGTTLSLVLERLAEDIHEPEFAAYAPLVGFEAFLPEQRLFGWLRLDADRLTDLLNGHQVVRLANVLVEDHADARAVAADEALVRRSEIVAVLASGPRGDPARRRTTTRHAVVMQMGRYRIGGNLHAAPGVDPQTRLDEGGPMIPLTEAWLEYPTADGVRREQAETVIVNRERAEDIGFGAAAVQREAR